MKELKAYIEANKDRFLAELFELIRIPSVSAKPENKADMIRCAEFIRDHLLQCGADKAEVMPAQGNPIVYAEKIIDPSKPTVMVYAHYDVQPAEPLELWTTPDPFEAVVKDGKIIARGANDDKGQMFMQVKAFEFLVKTNQLPCNVKFMIEGEEEVGSPSLGPFCREHTDLLKSDVILVSDTGMISNEQPSITSGLRGLAFMEVEVSGPGHDLHSGIFGGAVANPANVLCRMIASLHDAAGRVTIPGFYDDVRVLSAADRAELNRAPFDEQQYKKTLGVSDIAGEDGYTTLERTGIRPTLDVNGIWGGYTGEGAKTIIPSKAYAKISMRLVPNQNSRRISKLFEDHFKSIAPRGVSVSVKDLHGGEGYESPTDTKAYLAASKAYETTFGVKPIPTRSGGSIPIIALFEEVLGVKSILMGFGLESDAIHSPNENFQLFNFYKGIETIPWFYKYFCE